MTYYLVDRIIVGPVVVVVVLLGHYQVAKSWWSVFRDELHDSRELVARQAQSYTKS